MVATAVRDLKSREPAARAPASSAAPARARPSAAAALQSRIGNSGMQALVQRRRDAREPTPAGPLQQPRPATPDSRSAADKKADLDAGVAEALALAERQDVRWRDLPRRLDAVRARYMMRSLGIEPLGRNARDGTIEFEIQGEVNPKKKDKGSKKVEAAAAASASSREVDDDYDDEDFAEGIGYDTKEVPDQRSDEYRTAFARLNEPDLATGKLKPDEAEAALVLQTLLDCRVERSGKDDTGDFKFVNNHGGYKKGETIDFMYTSGSEEVGKLNEHLRTNPDLIDDSIINHARKANYVALDMRRLSPENKQLIETRVGQLLLSGRVSPDKFIWVR